MVVFFTGTSLAQTRGFEDPVLPGSTSGGQDLMPLKSEYDGGTIDIGASVQVISLFKNTSGQPITLKDLELIPSSNVQTTIGVNQCLDEPIQPGVECAITVNITGMSMGDYRVDMLLNHDARSRLSTAAITGRVGNANARNGDLLVTSIEAIPNELDFGILNSRNPLLRSLVLKNSTAQEVNISAIDLVAPDQSGFELTAIDCVALKPDQSCIVSVKWSPTSQGQSEGLIVVRHDAAAGVMSLGIKGDYQPSKQETASRFPSLIPGYGLLIADREEIDFDDEVDGAASITVSLVNNGDQSVTIQSLQLAGSDNGLSLAADGCHTGKILKPLQACPLTVNWLPRREGPIIDDIQIKHDGVRGVLVLPIRGEAIEPVKSDFPLMAVSHVNELPKLRAHDLDGNVNSNLSSKTLSSNMELSSGDSASLNGYKVTSHSKDRAVISGPRGRLIVKDGQIQVIGGSRWITNIVSDGVELTSKNNSVLLVFDPSFNFNNKNVSIEETSRRRSRDNDNE